MTLEQCLLSFKGEMSNVESYSQTNCWSRESGEWSRGKDGDYILVRGSGDAWLIIMAYYRFNNWRGKEEAYQVRPLAEELFIFLLAQGVTKDLKKVT